MRKKSSRKTKVSESPGTERTILFQATPESIGYFYRIGSRLQDKLPVQIKSNKA